MQIKSTCCRAIFTGRSRKGKWHGFLCCSETSTCKDAGYIQWNGSWRSDKLTCSVVECIWYLCVWLKFWLLSCISIFFFVCKIQTVNIMTGITLVWKWVWFEKYFTIKHHIHLTLPLLLFAFSVHILNSHLLQLEISEQMVSSDCLNSLQLILLCIMYYGVSTR